MRLTIRALGALLALATTTANATTVYVGSANDDLVRKIAPDGSISFPIHPNTGTTLGLAVDHRGNVYAAGSDTEVMEFDSGVVGSIWSQLPASALSLAIGRRDPTFNTPGNLYLALSNGNIEKVTQSFGLFGTPSVLLTGQPAPGALAVDGDENLYFAAPTAGVINKVPPAGVVSTFASSVSALALTFDHSGTLYATVSTGNGFAIDRFSSTGEAMLFYAGTALDDPHGLAFDDEGNLYVANLGNDTVSKITRTGNASVFASGIDGAYSVAVSQIAPVPIPAAVWLLISSLGAFGGLASRPREGSQSS